MQTAHSISATRRAAFAAPPEFRLLLAWDDFASGRRAVCFLERLVDEFGRMFTFVPSFLRFEDLRQPHVAQQMEDQAAEADLVVIAACGDAELPLLVKDWIRKLGAEKEHSDGALVALLSPGESGFVNDRPVHWHLSEAARRSGRKFLCNPIDWPAKEAAFPVEITWRNNQRGGDSQLRQAECPA
jgi:hypothetical protein